MLFAVNKHTKMHRPVQGVNEASQMTEYIAGADNDGWIDCRTKHNNPLPVGVRVDIKTACMPATVAGQTQMATVFTSPSEDVNWIEAAYYRAPLEALTHKPPLGPRRTQVDSGAVPNESKPKRQVDNETTKPNLLDELVAANERLLDARIAYDDALDAVRKAYPQLTIKVAEESDQAEGALSVPCPPPPASIHNTANNTHSPRFAFNTHSPNPAFNTHSPGSK